jgi:hypothetical protein
VYFGITEKFAMLRGWGRRDPPKVVWVLMLATLYLIVSALVTWPLATAVDRAVFESYFVTRSLVVVYFFVYCNPAQLYSTYNTVLSTFPAPAAYFRSLIASRTECKLVITKPLDSTQQYILALHPHGILPFGGMVNITSAYATIGVPLRGIVASFIFFIPLYREVRFSRRQRPGGPHAAAVRLGEWCAPRAVRPRDRLRRRVARLGAPRPRVGALALPVARRHGRGQLPGHRRGGTRCVAVARPFLRRSHGRAYGGCTAAAKVLDLNRRDGFVSLALETGAALVPCYSFGENDLHEQYAGHARRGAARRGAAQHSTARAPARACRYKPLPGTLLHYIRKRYQAATGTILPFLKNTVPLRGKRVVTVLGEPIPVERVAHPTAAQVQALHARYVAALRALYAKHEGKYHAARKQLVLLD